MTMKVKIENQDLDETRCVKVISRNKVKEGNNTTIVVRVESFIEAGKSEKFYIWAEKSLTIQEHTSE